MKKLFICALAFSTVFFCGCGEKSNEAEAAASTNTKPLSADVPADRVITPANVGDSPVNVKNLSDTIAAFEASKSEKEIAVLIDTRRGSITPGETKGINQNSSLSGTIVFRIQRADDDHGSFSGPIVIYNGKLGVIDNRPALLEARMIGKYEGDAIPDDQSLSWADMSTENPASVKTLLSATQPWKGLEITIKDVCKVPNGGNVIRFEKPGQENVGFFDKANYVHCTFKDSWTDHPGGEALCLMKGTFKEFDAEKGQVSLNNCAWVK